MPVSRVFTLATSRDPVEAGLADVAELRGLFARIPDPRKARGVRHRLASVRTVLVFAVLAGADCVHEAGSCIADLPPLHEAASTRRRGGWFLPPSTSTVRRLVEAIDADEADRLVRAWIAERARRHGGQRSAPGRYALAIGGKTVRRSAAPGGLYGVRQMVWAMNLPGDMIGRWLVRFGIG